MTDYEALTFALALALNAPDDQRAQLASEQAERIAARMEPESVEAAKRAAACVWHLLDARASLQVLGPQHGLIGNALYHDVMRSITHAAEGLGIDAPQLALLADTATAGGAT